MYIYQNLSLSERVLNNLLESHGDYAITLDINSIEYDISIVNKKLETEKSKLKIKSYTEIKKYLAKLKRAYENQRKETMSIMFDTDGIKVGGFPLETIKIDEPSLDIKLEYADYIVLPPTVKAKIVRLNFRPLMSALALEIARDDLGFSVKDVEEILEDTNLISVHSGSEINVLTDGDDLCRIVAGFKIGESEYYDKILKEARSYYLDKVRDNISYAGMIDFTMKKTMSVIICNMLKELDEYEPQQKVKLLAVYDDELVLAVSSLDDKASEIMSRPVTALVLGRKFIFNTTMTVVEQQTMQSERR